MTVIDINALEPEPLTTERLDTLQTAQDFYNFFDAIPAEKWCANLLQNNSGQRCAWGHLGRYVSEPEVIGNWQALCRLDNILGGNAIAINNGRNPKYQQDNPKDRILAALKDKMKETEGSSEGEQS